jgi:hypothetical protein
MGRYLNPSDQGERLHDLLQIVPSRPKRVNSRTPKAIHRRLRRAQVEELVIGYKTGSTVYQLSEQFRINRGTVSKLLERQGVPRRNRSLSPAQIERATELYATGCVNGQVLVPSFGQVKVPTPWVIQAVFGLRPPPL